MLQCLLFNSFLVLPYIKLNKTGLQTLHLHDFFTESVKINHGFAIGVLNQGFSNAIINFLDTSKPSILRVDLKDSGPLSFSGLNAHFFKTLQMRFYYTTPLQYIHTVTKSNPGDVRVSMDLSNALSLDPIKNSLLVQYQVIESTFYLFY